MRVAVFAITLLYSAASLVGAATTPQVPRRRAVLVRANPLREIEKRQNLPTEPCVPFSTQTPCDFDKICCPPLSLCTGSLTFSCIPTGGSTGGGSSGGDCPAGSSACVGESGCCPDGTKCTGDGHCDIPCLATDAPCGDGCCPARLGLTCNTKTAQCIVTGDSGSTSGTTGGTSRVVFTPSTSSPAPTSFPKPTGLATDTRVSTLGLMLGAVIAIAL